MPSSHLRCVPLRCQFVVVTGVEARGERTGSRHAFEARSGLIRWAAEQDRR